MPAPLVGKGRVPFQEGVAAIVQRATQRRVPHCPERSLPAKAIPELGKVPDRTIADRYGVPVETVRLTRALRGIGWRRGPHASPWNPASDALLGTLSDERLARKLGITATAVFQRRQVLGIAPFGTSIAEHRKKWTLPLLALLGKVPDRQVAERLEISTSAVVEKRLALGIPSCTGRRGRPQRRWTKKEEMLLGRWHDTDVARRLGISRRLVWAKRRSLGIPSATERELEARWTRSRLARLGQVPDRELAAEMGLTPAAVAVFRKRRGIPQHQPHPKSNANRRGQRAACNLWTPERIRRLGTVADARIAEEMGLTRAAVAAHRTRLGILPCHPPRRPRSKA